MTNKQQGFTLIELVAVIVILGALAVVALPRFIDLQDEAEQAAAEGVAGSISSAFAINYAASLAQADSATQDFQPVSASVTDFGFESTSAFNINDIMQSDISGYSADCSANSWEPSAQQGATLDCDVTSDADSNATATFTAIATSS